MIRGTTVFRCRQFGRASSRKAREGAHPQLFSVLSKKNPRYIPSLNWPTRPSRLRPIEPAKIPQGADRSAYPRFLAKVQMLKQAVGAFIELAMSSEQKDK